MKHSYKVCNIIGRRRLNSCTILFADFLKPYVLQNLCFEIQNNDS